MIAKGLDLPLVTVVGVVSADTALNLPDFRSSERTFQLLAQVAGRAGRGLLGGRVVLQTYHPDHYAVVAAAAHDYAGFAARELAFRREQGYPPYRRLAKLVYEDASPNRAQAEAQALAAAPARCAGPAGAGDGRPDRPCPSLLRSFAGPLPLADRPTPRRPGRVPPHHPGLSGLAGGRGSGECSVALAKRWGSVPAC